MVTAATTDPSIAPVIDASAIDPGLLSALVHSVATYLHVLRYRAPTKGVQEDFVFARPEKAREVAEKWLNQEPGRQLINVRQAIVADETGTIVPLPALPMKPPSAPSGTAPRITR